MRILFISNFYPPRHRGGYEEWCQEVAIRFVEAGHQLRVLTSTFEAQLADNDPDYVYRQLNLEMEIATLSNGLKFFTDRKKRIEQSLDHLRQHISELQPDAVLVWGMWNLPFEIPAVAEALVPKKVFYYLGDYWPTLPPQFKNYWEAKPGSWLTALPKALLAIPAKAILNRETRPQLALEHGLFCSKYLKDELTGKEIRFNQSHIIYGAIDTQPYQNLNQSDVVASNQQVQLLSISRLIPDKGIKTIVLAVDQLVNRLKIKNVCLKIVGGGDPEYLAELEALVTEKMLKEYVEFTGSVPKAEIPSLYETSDIFIFASVWPEPFGRVIVEAMASGVAVVGTAVGGAAEILQSGVNALTFEPEDAAGLADQLKRLINDSAMRRQIVTQARHDAIEKFDLGRMFKEIEKVISSQPSH